MSTPTVPEQQREPSPWLDIADELRRMADDFETLVGEPAPGYVALDIQPGQALQPETAAAVDAAAAALLRMTPETKRLSGGTYHRRACGRRGQVSVSVYQEVAGPPDERDAELARLRAEVEKLRASGAPDGLDYSRPADSDDPQPLSGRIPPSYGAVADSSMRLVPLLNMPMRVDRPRGA